MSLGGETSVVALDGRRRDSRKAEQISDKEWTCESSGQDGGVAMQFVGWFVKKKKCTCTGVPAVSLD